MASRTRLHVTGQPGNSAVSAFRRRRSVRPVPPRVARAALEALEDRRLFATFAVTTTADGGPGSLRQAILSANAAAGADVVTVPVGTYTLSIAGAGEDAGATGDLDITGPLTITGAGAATTTVNGGDIDRIFDIRNLVPVTITGLTVTNGQVTGDGGGIRNTGALTLDGVTLSNNRAVSNATVNGDGAGLFTEATTNNSISGTTTIRNSIISGNIADDDGGGIYHVPADGDLVIQASMVMDNVATDGDAGGLYHVPGRGDLTITTSRVDGNEAEGDAGGIYSVAFAGNFSLTDSFVNQNQSGEGGGVYHVPRTGNLLVTNSSISSNESTGDAGGLYFVPATGNLTITGGTVAGNVADGEGGGILFSPAQGTAPVTFTNVIIGGNSATGEGGGINTDGGSLTLTGCVLDGNTAGGDGGGIEAEGDITLNNCTVTGNRSTGGDGGGVNLNDSGVLSLTETEVRDNTAGGRGGGVRTSNDVTVLRSTLAGNTAGSEGGGLWTKQAVVRVTNSTVSGNTAETSGGGIFVRATEADVALLNVTVADNEAGTMGGGVFVEEGAVAPVVKNTIIAGNTADEASGPDVFGAFNSGGNNLIGAGFQSTGFTGGVNGDLVGDGNATIDPLLGPLAANGGPTRTHALLPGSPAINAAGAGAPATDQRGVARPQGAASDIGAFEFQAGAAVPSLRINDVSRNEGNSGTTAFAFTVTRTGDTSAASSVNFATSFGTGANATDLAAQNGTVTFATGETSKTITIQVNGDTTVEGNDVFFVNLTGPTNATLSDAQGRGTIVNDDTPPPPAARGSISGHVFDDRNLNQRREGGEPVLSGFTVYIDQDRDGRLDTAERRVTTNGEGGYRFSNLSAGTYVVRLVIRPGFRQTKPLPGGAHTVALRAGQNAGDRGFGVTRQASISGTVFRDRDRNGRLDAGETLLSGRRVFLDRDGDGRVDRGEAVAVTNSRGQYSFASVTPGTVRVRLLLAGSVPTAPSGGLYTLAVRNGQVITGRNFGVR